MGKSLKTTCSTADSVQWNDGSFFSKPKKIVAGKAKIAKWLWPDLDLSRQIYEKGSFSTIIDTQSPKSVIKVPVFEDENAFIDEDENVVEPVEDFDAVDDCPRDFPVLSIFENSHNTNNVLAVVRDHLEFYGTVIVTLLCGQIEINGFKPSKQVPVTLYSPKGFCWVLLSPTEGKANTTEAVNLEGLAQFFSKAQLENITTSYNVTKNSAIVLLQKNAEALKLSRTLSKHMAENVFPQVDKLKSNRPLHASEYLLQCLVQGSDRSNNIQVPKAWEKLSGLRDNSRLMIAGGKAVGKSTLLRYLVNCHLSRFPRLLLIDLDIGQPELFVPQTISCSVIDGPLLGPGFLQNKQPDKAIMVGSVNIVMCAEQYAKAVEQLLKYCHSAYKDQKIPWLINTMGYNRGFGLEVMSQIVHQIQPTDLVEITSSKNINNFEYSLDWDKLSKLNRIIYTADEFKTEALSKYALHRFPSVVPSHSNAWKMSAKDVRYANLLTRLSCALKGNAVSLTDCQPVLVPLDRLQILSQAYANLSREEIVAGMEANVVYLCKTDRTAAKPKQLPECMGIGVVRAIDYARNSLYLVPAMPFERLESVNCLVLGGDWTLPQGFFKDQGHVGNKVPFVFIVDDSKSSKSIRQIYFRPPEFINHQK